jgi:hypothetical protein
MCSCLGAVAEVHRALVNRRSSSSSSWSRARLGRKCLPPPSTTGQTNRWYSSTSPAVIAWVPRVGPPTVRSRPVAAFSCRAEPDVAQTNVPRAHARAVRDSRHVVGSGGSPRGVEGARAASDVAEAFQVSAAAATLRAVEAPHDPAAPVLAGWSSIATILSVASSAPARAKGRLADDPPADDFSRPTRAFHRRMRLGEVESLVEPLGEAGAVGLELSRALFDDSADSGALVRSFEIAPGAFMSSARGMTPQQHRRATSWVCR